jgi:hypothetical protein
MIFNKKDKGATELFNATGTYWQTNDFAVIRSEVESAETSVRSLVGEALFDRAEAFYKREDDVVQDNVDSSLVKKLQTAVAMLAMYRYYQQVLSHEVGGRKLKIATETEKHPWAWELERDDAALLDKYHRALDELYIFVEKNEIAEWKQSRISKDRAACLVRDLGTFQRSYPIEDSHRMFYLLVPFMLEAQERHIVPVVGKDNFEKILLGEDLDEDLTAQLEAARRCVPLFAVITAVKRMSVKILPTMIVRRFTDSFQGRRGGNLDQDAERRLLQTLEQEAADAKTDLQKVVAKCRIPFNEDDLVPKNDPRRKFCMT